jgi:hypothetical protein
MDRIQIALLTLSTFLSTSWHSHLAPSPKRNVLTMAYGGQAGGRFLSTLPTKHW